MSFFNIKKIRTFWESLGPGLVTGAADDDPSGIATYSQAGAQSGFQLLWLALFTFPLMAVVQEMCARIGMVSGRGLAENIRREYPAWVLYIVVGLLFCANTFNIAADIRAMAASTQLILPLLNTTLLVISFALVCLGLQIFTTYQQYARYLKYLTVVLFSYIIVGFMAHIDWHQALLHTIIPSFSWSRESLIIICGILGTTISPYLFFWQSSQEVEEEIAMGRTTVEERSSVTPAELTAMRTDVWSGMFVSNVVMFFIILVCGAELFSHGITTITSAADAARALVPFAGPFASLLFSVGVIGTGLLAIPILAGSSAYAIAETMHWHEGLYLKWGDGYGFYGTIVISMILALLLGLVGIDPIKALIYSAVLNGIVAPVMLYFIVHIASNRSIMGEWANSRLISTMGWFLTGIMMIASLSTLISFVI